MRAFYFLLALSILVAFPEAESAAEMVVRWPDGRVQRFKQVLADRRVKPPHPLDAAEAPQNSALYAPEAGETDADAHGNEASGGQIVIFLLAITLLLAATLLITRNATRINWQGLRKGAAIGLSVAILVVGMVWMTKNRSEESASPGTELAGLLAEANAIVPQRLPSSSPEAIRLGRALFWDPLVSGNKDVSCATCHHPTLATGDNLSLSIGTGGRGLGEDRVFGQRSVLIPRNAPPVYNMALAGMDTLFWDGRVIGTAEIGFDSPADDDLPFGLDSAVAVQAMFPVTSRDEMRGRPEDRDVNGERNELAILEDDDWNQIWAAIMARLLAVPEYQRLFYAAYPAVPTDELGFEHAANALAAYQMATFTFLDSPWDRYLEGEETAVSPEALEGAHLFYGKAGCAECHSGPLLSDMQFHNIGVPQVGPGKGIEEPLDYGRARETGDERDLFAFRTPPLRNVAITGPWMHDGAYTSLEAAVRHHLNPVQALVSYDVGQLTPIMQAGDTGRPEVHNAASTAPSLALSNLDLTVDEINSLLAFLNALTSPSAEDLSATIPNSVPSGLTVGGR